MFNKNKPPGPVQKDDQVLNEILKYLKQLVQIQKAKVEHETDKQIKLKS